MKRWFWCRSCHSIRPCGMFKMVYSFHCKMCHYEWGAPLCKFLWGSPNSCLVCLTWCASGCWHCACGHAVTLKWLVGRIPTQNRTFLIVFSNRCAFVPFSLLLFGNKWDKFCLTPLFTHRLRFSLYEIVYSLVGNNLRLLLIILTFATAVGSLKDHIYIYKMWTIALWDG